MFIKRSTEELRVKGAVGGRSKITSEEGRVLWVKLFPFPEVIAKYGHGARNRYFPLLFAEIVPSVVWVEVHYKHTVFPGQERVLFTLGKLLPESGV